METEETEETEAEPIFDQVMPENDEPVIEETSVTFEEEPMAVDVAPEAPVTEEPIVEKEPVVEETKADSNSVNSDLKQDIKSVLLYMDQLLENLPEEKIVEFAKSDEFTTYKKLFSELGLS